MSSITFSDGHTTRTLATDVTPEQGLEVIARLLEQFPQLKIVKPDQCPSWCELENGHADWSIDNDGFPGRAHQGPHFGPFLVGAEERLSGMDAPTVILGDLDGTELDAAGMRQFAQDASDAAAWLEEHK